MEAKEARGESGSPRAFSEAPPEAEINDVTVSGAAAEPLNYIISVHLMHVVFPFEFMQMDVKPWFLGFPAGVTALVTAMGGVGGFTTIEISLSGVPLEGIAGLIKLRIPGDYLSSGETLDTDDNPNAVWDIEGRSARVNDAVVAGGVGNPLDYTITGRIYHDYFKNAVNVPCESWFLGGFPAGLTALANTIVTSLNFSIHITGTPSETFAGLIRLCIPGAYLDSGIDLYTDENPNAKWEIGRGEAAISDVSVNGTRYAPIAPVSARISALTQVITYGSNFAAGMAFAKLVFYSPSFPKSAQVFLRGAGWMFSMEYSPDDMGYHLRFTAPAGQHDIWTSLGGWSGCQLGDFSFDAATATAAGPFGAATAVNIPSDGAFSTARFYAGFRAVEAGADLSAWFLNLPAGLNATAEAAAEGALSVGVTFSGTPRTAESEEIEAFVPGTVAAAGMQLDVQPNENAVFAIEPNPPGAALSQNESGTGNVLIRGFCGKDISTFSQNLQAYITLKEDTFASKVGPGYDISGWLDNAPGISLTCTQSLSARKKIQIRFGGIPERLLFAPIRITIPADCIDQGKETFVAEDDDNKFEFYTSAYIGDVTVAGVAGTPIEPVTARIGVIGDDFFALPAGADVAEIFRNRIPGLSFLTAAAVPDKADYVDCAISGTPQYALSNEIYATVPAGMLRGGYPAQAPNNPNARFAIEPAPEPPSATVGDATVAGVAGQEITPVPIEISVSGDEFRQMSPGADCSAWFQNLPEGLAAEAQAGIQDGATSAVLTVEGTPEEASGEAFSLIIPAAAVHRNDPIPVTTNPNAKFAIEPAPGPEPVGVEFVALSANGSADAETSAVFLTFSQDVPSLSASDISIALPGGTVQTGDLTADGGGRYTLAVSGVSESATATVAVSKTGFAFSPAARTAFVYGAPVVQKSAAIGDAVVAGSSFAPIEPVTARISVTNDSFNAMAAETDVSAWFTNLPEGLSAAAAETADGAAVMEAEISGTPAGGAAGPIEAEIPASALHGGAAVPVEINPNAIYQIGAPAAQATIGSVVVAGTAWEAISPAAARFAVSGDKFRAITAGKDLSLWFQNLPAGLSAKAAGTADKSEHAEAVLEGTPATGMLGTIQAQIPAAALYGNTAVAVALNANAIFAINPAPFSWELKKEITDQDYETLTQGDDRVALRCIAKAEIWVKGKVLSTGNEYNTSDEVIRELVLKRGVYELFVFNSYEERAEEKYRDLIELIESYFGEVDSKIPDGGGTSDEPWIGPSVGAMAPAKDWGIRYGR